MDGAPRVAGLRITACPATVTAVITNGGGRARAAALMGAGAALLLVGLNMRPAVVALSPLLGEVQAATGLSSGAAGALYAVPVLCFGVLAPFAPRIVRRLGLEGTVCALLVVLLAGIALRLRPSLVPLFVGTFLVGVAVAVANVAVTTLIKNDFPDHIALLSGLHSTMLVGGGALAAGLTLPIRDALGLTWPQALAAWGAPALVALAVWLPALRRNRRVESAGDVPVPAALVWRSALGWNVALFYGLQSLLYYTVTGWLPTFYADHGVPPAEAGGLLSVLLVAAIVSSVGTPLLAERPGRQGPLAAAGGVLCAASLLGLLLAPTAAPALWCVLFGLGIGAALSLGIQYMAIRAGGTREAALLSAMSQCVGYLVALSGPALFGLAFDGTGGWVLGLAGLTVLVVPMVVTGVIAGRGGEITHRSVA